MQAEQAAAAAKAEESRANTERVKTMTPYEISKLIADKDTSVAQGGLHLANTKTADANTRKVTLEGDALNFGNIHRQALVKAVEGGALTVNQETGELTLNPNASPAVIGSIAATLPAAELVKLPGLISQYNLNIKGQAMTPAAQARNPDSAGVNAVAPIIQAQEFNGGGGGGKPMSMADQKNYTDVIQNTAKALMLRYTNSSQELSEADAIAIATKATSLYPMMRPDLAVQKMLSENNLTIGPVQDNLMWFDNDRVTLRKGDPGNDGDKRKASEIDPYSFTPAPRTQAQPATIAGTVAPAPANAAPAGVTQVGGPPAGGNAAIANPAASTGNAVTDHNVARTIAGAVSQEGNGTNVTPPAVNPNLGQPNQGVQGGPRVISSAQEITSVKEGELISVQGKILKKMNGQFVPIQ
jgi:hypothetical protein